MSLNEIASVIHVKELGLSRRLENLLLRKRIYTLAQLLEFIRDQEELKAHGFGPAALKELNQIPLMNYLTRTKNEPEKPPESLDETRIETLSFSVRVRNALLRSDINTVAQLLTYKRNNDLAEIRNLGPRGIEEIVRYLEVLSEPAQRQTTLPSSLTEASPQNEHQLLFEELGERMKKGQLNPLAKVQGFALGEINAGMPGVDFLVKEVGVALKFSDVGDELSEILNSHAKEDQFAVLQRFGFSRKTLREVGELLGVTRERVRQREERVLRQLPVSFGARPYLHIQSALLLGQEMKSRGEFSASSWEAELRRVGLLSSDVINLDCGTFRTIEALVALNELGVKRQDHLPFLFFSGLSKAFEAPDLSVETILDVERYKGEFTRDIDRIIRIAGAISVKHAPVFISIGYKNIHNLLQHLGYEKVSGEWYSKKLLQKERSFSHQAALLNNVLLILKCIGEVNISELREGLQRGAEKHRMTVAPAWVLAKILSLNGFQVQNDKVTWPFENKSELRGRRQILFQLFQEAGPVVSSTKIIHAFDRAGQSEASAVLAMQYSPLIQRIERSLYKFIGSKVLDEDIYLFDRRQKVIKRTPLAKEQAIDGLLVVSVEVGTWIKKGILPINTTLQLQGAWKAICEGEIVCTILNKNGTIKPLSPVLERLGISQGEQLQLAFDPKMRHVILSKAAPLQSEEAC